MQIENLIITETFITLIILFGLTIVQSIIGVGILLFGTPIFLLLDYDFFNVLILLLPTSILISFMTFIVYRKSLFNLIDLCIMSFFVFSGSMLSLNYFQNVIYLLVAGVIFLGIFIKIISHYNISHILNNNKNIVAATIGFLHGASNQGGIILVFFAKSYNVSKNLTRSSIALAYLIFAIMQLTSLMYTDLTRFVNLIKIENIVVPAIGFFVGNLIFRRLQGKSYDNVINVSTGVFILMLIYKSLGI